MKSSKFDEHVLVPFLDELLGNGKVRQNFSCANMYSPEFLFSQCKEENRLQVSDQKCPVHIVAPYNATITLLLLLSNGYSNARVWVLNLFHVPCSIHSSTEKRKNKIYSIEAKCH